MGIIGWIVVGLLAGGLARWIVKDDRSGCIYTMIVGVIGALIGGGLMSLIDESGVDEFSFRSIIVAVIGAVLLLLILQAIAGRGRSKLPPLKASTRRPRRDFVRHSPRNATRS